MSTQLFRHGDRGYGSLTKRRIPDEVLDDWFGPATRSAAIRYDLRKFTAGTPSRKTLLDWASRLSSFSGPVLVIWGADDAMMPVEHAHLLVEEFPDARLVLVEDSRTLISEDQPERFAAELSRFVTAR
ncbi:MAG TPA: alpha/beta hydrolase [Gordonia sp. (in: high G+C Gram-positive bacteria)]|uniref:alpha/beta fold hydrolase n=1 Tax=unclassified Gordonia (in: high G+C Gram-positive bacteria) TaxID=2657482 RepID=UPI0025BC4551|nr:MULTISPECIES: alpha/beta hydrolase [unclassified Gordonia (in: high G+C Gram-positive bacteria)]HNP56698.1 alpha/beta hydrolase [Gordonia sp. (in: high G+C Gram-positive bacteria)]HRC51934.1 alpha/beta hydrolase [Gordonia sp. (in: high G+C Gram-positive bacteria)]